MPGAVIAINQDRPGPSTSFGSPGVARNDLWQGRTIRPTVATSGNSSYSWVLLRGPAGSASVITSADQPACALTPDLPGSYRLQLETNGGGPGNVQILICAVRYDINGVLVNRGWRIPAVGETASEDNFLGQTRGWSEAYETTITDVLAALGASNGQGDENGRSLRTRHPSLLRSVGRPPAAVTGSFSATITGAASLEAYLAANTTVTSLVCFACSNGFYRLFDPISLTTSSGTVGSGPVFVYATGNNFILVGNTSFTILVPDGITSPVVVNSIANFGGAVCSIAGTEAGVANEILLLTSPVDNTVYAYNLTSGGSVTSVLTLPSGSHPLGIVQSEDNAVWVALKEDGTVTNAVIKKYSANGVGSLTYSGVTISNFLATSQLVYDGKYVWGVGAATPGILYRLRVSDYTVATVQVAASLGSSSNVTFDGESIWVTTSTGLVRVHPETLEILQTTSIASAGPVTVSPDGALFVGAGTTAYEYRLTVSRQLDRLKLYTAATAGHTLKVNGNGEVVGTPVAPSPFSYTLLGGVASTTAGSGTPLVVGSAYIRPSDWPVAPTGMTRKVFFRCLLETTNGSNTANLDLLDRDGASGTAGTEVASSNLQETALTAQYHEIELAQLEGMSSSGVFHCRLWINPSAGGQTATCREARIDVVCQ